MTSAPSGPPAVLPSPPSKSASVAAPASTPSKSVSTPSSATTSRSPNPISPPFPPTTSASKPSSMRSASPLPNSRITKPKSSPRRSAPLKSRSVSCRSARETHRECLAHSPHQHRRRRDRSRREFRPPCRTPQLHPPSHRRRAHPRNRRGRHPVIERLMENAGDQRFVPNDLFLDASENTSLPNPPPHHRTQHGRQVHLPPPGGTPRYPRPDGKLRPRRSHEPTASSIASILASVPPTTLLAVALLSWSK